MFLKFTVAMDPIQNFPQSPGLLLHLGFLSEGRLSNGCI